MPNRGDLAALEESIARIEGAISARVAPSACWPERMRVGLQTLLVALAENPGAARMALVDGLGAGEPAIARIRAAMASLVPILEEGRGGGGDGDSSSEAEARGASTDHLPPQTSEAVVGGIASILHRRILDGHTAELPALLPDLLYFALMPYLGHERASAAAGAARTTSGRD